jgi:hypothetical protein
MGSKIETQANRTHRPHIPKTTKTFGPRCDWIDFGIIRAVVATPSFRRVCEMSIGLSLGGVLLEGLGRGRALLAEIF